MDATAKLVSNWLTTGGDLAKAVQVKLTHEDAFIKPELSEILCEERAILLKQPNPHNDTNLCELVIRVLPHYKIKSLSLVCNTAKVELFIGPPKEYNKTIYGDVIEDDHPDFEYHDQTIQLFSYRYDIEINKSGAVEIMLKLPRKINPHSICHNDKYTFRKLIGSRDEICIFGIILAIATNLHGITTPVLHAINLDNVQQMLQNSNLKLSPNAEKCKMFMQMYKSAQQPEKQATLNKTMEYEPVTEDLKMYIEARFTTLEEKLLTQLTNFETRQLNKLNKILNLLEIRDS